MKNQAFTLVEIIITVVIVGILAAVALPKYNLVIEKTYARNAERILLELAAAQKRYFIDTDTYTQNLGDLDIDLRANDKFRAPIACDLTIANGCTINHLAKIERDSTTLSYTLEIDNDMTITCLNPVPVTMCTKLGY